MTRSRFAGLTSTALLACILLLSGAAHAQTVPGDDGDSARAALESMLRTTYQPFHETTRVSRDGTRVDRQMHVRASWEQLLQKHSDAYRFERTLEGGARCKGYFVSPAKRLATFTLDLGGRSFMVISQETPDGVVLTVWGTSRIGADLRQAPFRQARPYYQGVPEAPTRSYGL